MNNINKKSDIEIYEELLKSTPLEVRNFLWSDAYKLIIESISEVYKLNDNQTSVVSSVIFDLTIGYINEAEAKNKLNEVKIDQTTQQKIFADAFEYIISPALKKMDSVREEIEEEGIYEDDEDLEVVDEENINNDKETKEQKTTYKSRDTVFNELNKKLNQSSISNVIERDHTIKDSNVSRKIDPYREIPD